MISIDQVIPNSSDCWAFNLWEEWCSMNFLGPFQLGLKSALCHAKGGCRVSCVEIKCGKSYGNSQEILQF